MLGFPLKGVGIDFVPGLVIAELLPSYQLTRVQTTLLVVPGVVVNRCHTLYINQLRVELVLNNSKSPFLRGK